MQRKLLGVSRIILGILVSIQLIDVTFHPFEKIFPLSDMIWPWIVYELAIWIALELAIAFVIWQKKDYELAKTLDPIAPILLTGIASQYLAMLLGYYTTYDFFDQITHFSIMGVVGSMMVYRFVWAYLGNKTHPYQLLVASFTIMMALNTMHEIAEYVMVEIAIRQYPELFIKLADENNFLDTGNDLLMVMGGTITGLAFSSIRIKK